MSAQIIKIPSHARTLVHLPAIIHISWLISLRVASSVLAFIWLQDALNPIRGSSSFAHFPHPCFKLLRAVLPFACRPRARTAMPPHLSPEELDFMQAQAHANKSPVQIHAALAKQRARKNLDEPDLTTVRRALKGVSVECACCAQALAVCAPRPCVASGAVPCVARSR